VNITSDAIQLSNRAKAIIESLVRLEQACSSLTDFSPKYFQKLMDSLENIRLEVVRDKVIADSKNKKKEKSRGGDAYGVLTTHR